jgi:carboxypeptidase C (cathepsin A)
MFITSIFIILYWMQAVALIPLLSIAAGAFSDTDGPWSFLGQTGYAGEVVVNNETGSSIFYWQFNSLNRNISTDRVPLLIWFQGGPGCSSSTGMLGERISPIYIDDNAVPHFNNGTWASTFHLMSIDYPYNTGFSYAAESSDLRNNTLDATVYLYSFFQTLAAKYPVWFKRDIYVFGESYAGHWLPALAYKIIQENQSAGITGVIPIPLKGIGLGDPVGDYLYQSQLYSYYSYNLGLTSLYEQDELQTTQGLIYTSILSENYVDAYNYLNMIQGQVFIYSGEANLFNIRHYESSYPNIGNVSGWLNLNSTKSLLNVPLSVEWYECNEDITAAFGEDSVEGFVTPIMPTVIENIKVLIYSAQDDVLVNTLGIKNWLVYIKWPYISNFLASRRGQWYVQGKLAGYAQSYMNMNFIQIINSGQFVPFDQPTVAKDMVQRFINNQGWN